VTAIGARQSVAELPGASPAAATRLPARVVRAIEAQRERSEILTSWVQALLVAVLATLYIVAPKTSPADAIIVLSSARRSDQSGGFNRLLRGIELLSENRAPRLVIAEADPPMRSYTADARDLMGRLRLTQELHVLEPITNTRSEAVKVGELFREKGWKIGIVVTSAAHSRRASGALEHEGVDVISSPSADYRFDLRALHTWRDRLAAFGSVMHEWIGIWMYHRRGWIPSSAV